MQYAEKINSMQSTVDQIKTAQTSIDKQQQSEPSHERKEDEEDDRQTEADEQLRSSDEEDEKKKKQQTEEEEPEGEAAAVDGDEAAEPVEETASVSESGKFAKTGKKVSWSQPPAVTIPPRPITLRLSARQRAAAFSKSQPEPVKQHETRLVYGDIADIMEEGQLANSQDATGTAVNKADEAERDNTESKQSQQSQSTLKQQLDREKRAKRHEQPQGSSELGEQKTREARKEDEGHSEEAKSVAERAVALRVQKKQQAENALRIAQERQRHDRQRRAELAERQQSKQQQTAQQRTEEEEERVGPRLRSSFTQPSPTPPSQERVRPTPPRKAADDTSIVQRRQVPTTHQVFDDLRSTQPSVQPRSKSAKPPTAAPTPTAANHSKRRVVQDVDAASSRSTELTTNIAASVASAPKREPATAKRREVGEKEQRAEVVQSKRLKKQEAETEGGSEPAPEEVEQKVAPSQQRAVRSSVAKVGSAVKWPKREADQSTTATASKPQLASKQRPAAVSGRKPPESGTRDRKRAMTESDEEIEDCIAWINEQAPCTWSAEPAKLTAPWKTEKRQRKEAEEGEQPASSYTQSTEEEAVPQPSHKRSRPTTKQPHVKAETLPEWKRAAQLNSDLIQGLIEQLDKTTVITETTVNRRTVQHSRSRPVGFTAPPTRAFPAVPPPVVDAYNTAARRRLDASRQKKEKEVRVKPEVAQQQPHPIGRPAQVATVKQRVSAPSVFLTRSAVSQSPVSDFAGMELDDIAAFFNRLADD